jgi:cytochrome P450
MLHDEKVYPDPFQFKPERFLTPDGLSIDKSVKDPGDIVWGFGRRFVQQSLFLCSLEKKKTYPFSFQRICPGRFFAESTFWIAITSIIAAFDIEKIGESPGTDHGHIPGIAR